MSPHPDHGRPRGVVGGVSVTVRPATVDDCGAILGIAERSFQASYSLSPEQIAVILEEEFAGDVLAARIEDDESLVVVAEDGGTVLGFADAGLETGTLRWLHVDPSGRGGGLGTSLVERVVEELADCDEPLTAHVLDDAAEGGSFLERFGLHRSDTRPAEFGDGGFSSHVYTRAARESEANEPAVAVPEHVTVEGTERPVDRTEWVPGTEAPFFPIDAGPDGSDRYGFFCSSCGGTDVSADDLDRLECGDCGNGHRADEWDDAYL